ncbi:MAG: iron chaperone [Dehalococcoidia bacterium]
MDKKPTTLDEYLATVPEEFRAALEELRQQIRGVVPDATEGVAYGLAAFKYRGKPLAYIGAAKRHCGLYGMDATGFEEPLAGYEVSKGTIRFVPPQTLPPAVVEGMIRRRAAEIDADAPTRKTKKGARDEPSPP